MIGNKFDNFEALMNIEKAQGLLMDFPPTSQAAPYLWPDLPSLTTPPDFPVAELPEGGRDMVEAVSEALQTPLGMAACFLLGAISTCIVGRGSVQVSPGYEEPLLLYITVAANPSERKSPTMEAMFKPIYDYETERNKELNPLLLEAQARLGVKRKQLIHAQNKGDENTAISILKDIAKLEELHPYSLIMSEGTTEALLDLMAKNDDRIAVVSAEGAIFGILMGMYSTSGVNLDVILQGYSGEPVNTARVGRQTAKIKKASLSITLAVQPIVIREFLASEIMLGRGTVGRFLLSWPSTFIGYRKPNPIPVPDVVKQRYATRLRAILEMKSTTLSLSDAALIAYHKWFNVVEKRLAPGNDLGRLPSGWGGKVCGNTIRIAGLLCLFEGKGDIVEDDVMQSAITIAQYFIDQQLSLTKAERPISLEAAEVLQYIEQKGQDQFSPYLFRQDLRNRKRFEKGETVDHALMELEGAGYIRKGMPPEYGGTGRRPEAVYHVHPDLIKKNKGKVIELCS